jgi:CheY-like chemotaxis protein
MSLPHPHLNRRVLAVDDNPAIHEDFRKILLKPANADNHFDDLESAILEPQHQPAPHEGFELDSAFQGEEGLAKVRQAVEQGRPYSVAFVDMRMPPGWDGIETIAQLWQADPHLQIVICTAYSDYSWEEILRQLGNRHSLAVLKKPFDNIELIQLCETMSQKWSLRRRLHAHEPIPPEAEPLAASGEDGTGACPAAGQNSPPSW